MSLCMYRPRVFATSDTVSWDVHVPTVTTSHILHQLTWLALDEDQVARSRRVEQLNALRGL